MSESYLNTVRHIVDFLKGRGVNPPKVFMVLTGGLDSFADQLTDSITIASHEIPHLPRATAEGHRGEFRFGNLNGVPVMVQLGRFHFYDGHSMQIVTLPVHVAHELGATGLIVTNVSGSVNATFKPGTLMMMTDHINLMGDNPLKGIATLRKTNQFTDMTNAYTSEFFPLIRSSAKKIGISICEGTYIAVSGPNYETKAEIKAFRTMGADAVGMSTVPEVIVANFYGMKVAGISLLSNLAADLHAGGMSHSEVLSAMQTAMPNFVKLLNELVPKVSQ